MYYDNRKILETLDIDGLEPSVYIITSNRSAGKTTSFLKTALDNFKQGQHTIMLYRYSYELSGSNEIFKDVLSLYSEYGKEVTTVSHARGLFYEYLLDGETLGFALSLSNVDSIKKFSPLFAKVTMVIMDEFQTESGKYLPKEVDKVQSLLLTVARGGGKQSREIKLILLGNNVSLMNPYYITFGIHKRLQPNTKILRGKGWVAEFGFNESASKSIQENGIYRAFNSEQQSNYMQYSTEQAFLKDVNDFIEQPKGKAKYLCTISHDNEQFAIREYYEDGVLHVSQKVDKLCKTIITFKANDHNQNSIMIDKHSWLAKMLKDAFKNGYLRFSDVKSKSVIFDVLAIDIYS